MYWNGDLYSVPLFLHRSLCLSNERCASSIGLFSVPLFLHRSLCLSNERCASSISGRQAHLLLSGNWIRLPCIAYSAHACTVMVMFSLTPPRLSHPYDLYHCRSQSWGPSSSTTTLPPPAGPASWASTSPTLLFPSGCSSTWAEAVGSDSLHLILFAACYARCLRFRIPSLLLHSCFLVRCFHQSIVLIHHCASILAGSHPSLPSSRLVAHVKRLLA
jgi:hypothetical protein